MSSTTQPRVTIVMTARERHALTLGAIDSVLRETPRPFRFVVTDCGAPDWLRAALAPYVARGELEAPRYDAALWPQAARRRALAEVDSEYVVFLDNDVVVAPGWLDRLVRCADETGAAMVGPLTLWSDGVHAPTIHMAGGSLRELEVEGGRVLEELHLEFNQDPEKVPLARRTCDFLEFHCMLVRTSLLERGALLEPDIVCVHEHVDLSLALRARGGTIWLEPAARVTYLALAEFKLAELPFFRARWAMPEAERSIARFCAKWGVVNDERSFGGARHFVRAHNAQVDPVRHGAEGLGRERPMQAADLCQTRSALLELALARGYPERELARLAQAYDLALVLLDGYRPCGRPFLNHVCGTASVLVRYDLRVELCCAALLHAAYSHCPPHRGGPALALENVRAALGGEGSPLEQRVRAYTLRASGPRAEPVPWHELGMLDAEILMLSAANEIDMHLSGELRWSGRTDELGAAQVARIAEVADVLGVRGLAETLAQARASAVPVPRSLVTGRGASYRIGPDRRSAVPMVSTVPALLRRG